MVNTSRSDRQMQKYKIKKKTRESWEHFLRQICKAYDMMYQPYMYIDWIGNSNIKDGASLYTSRTHIYSIYRS